MLAKIKTHGGMMTTMSYICFLCGIASAKAKKAKSR